MKEGFIMKTNKGLVKFVKKQLYRPYWYGCFGQISSVALYNAKKKQYPKQYQWECKDNQSGVLPFKQLGVPVFDCIGLIKSYIWRNSIGKINYNPAQDVSANEMLNRCVTKGLIAKMPEIPGILVFMDGHVGVYIGDGYVIEARGHVFGVVKTALKDRPWKNWGYCPYIIYLPEKKKKTPKKKVKTYFKKYTGKSESIVDALKNIGANSNYDYRKRIAKANGIKDYSGTPKQNIKMLKLLKKGKLIKPEG